MEDTRVIGLYWARDEGGHLGQRQNVRRAVPCLALPQSILESPEECVNDTWHRGWDAMPPQPRSLRAFFAAITRNLFLNRWRESRAGGWMFVSAE